MRTTHTYATMEVKETTWNDIYNRIKELAKIDSSYLDVYFEPDGEILTLGSIGLVKEKKKRLKEFLAEKGIVQG